MELSNILKMLKQMVEIESPSTEKAAVDRLGVYIAEQCESSGAAVLTHQRQEVGDLIEARWEPQKAFLGDGKKSGKILLLCHMDTVFPLGTLEKMPYFEKDGKLYGPGVSDMKGGIAVGLATMRSLTEIGSLPRHVTALFTSDEEIGSHASREMIEALAKQASLVIVLEPGMTDGSLKTWRKGVGTYEVRAHGRAAHAGGNHSDGRNAIEELAYQVLAIQELTDYSRGTTLNIGIIRGGLASNVVPDEAFVEVDLRVMQPGEAERIEAILKSLKPRLDGTTLNISGELNRPPMPFDQTMKTTFSKVKSFASQAGLTLTASGTGGASDANFVAPLGIPVLDGLGPAGGEYHSEREFTIKESLTQRIQLLTTIIHEW